MDPVQTMQQMQQQLEHMATTAMWQFVLFYSVLFVLFMVPIYVACFACAKIADSLSQYLRVLAFKSDDSYPGKRSSVERRDGQPNSSDDDWRYMPKA